MFAKGKFKYFTFLGLLFALQERINGSRSIDILNPRPVIGILTQECQGTSKKFCGPNKGYVAASYIKWIESSGGRPFIIPLNCPISKLKMLLKNNLSGLLLPGGADNVPKYTKMAYAALRWSENGEVSIPIWGTCLGFETMAKYFFGEKILDRTIYTTKVGLSLQLTEKRFTHLNDYVFKNAPRRLKKSFENRNITYNYHRWSLLPGKNFGNTGWSKNGSKSKNRSKNGSKMGQKQAKNWTTL